MIKIKNELIKKIISVILLIILFVFYISLIINTDISYSILDEINSKYIMNDLNIEDNLLLNSINKTISDNSIETETVQIVSDNIKEENNKKKIIYIYNTHESEKYSSPFTSDYSITPDVKLASYILKDYLNDLGIESHVEKGSISEYLKKHKLDYKGSYEASRYYMENELKNNDYKILIDLHRDSVSHKYTLYEKDNKKYAKVMFVLAMKNKNYKENEKFVNYLDNKINKKYKGLSRGIMKRKDVIFNQDKSPNAILIELGGVDNTLEEINNTLEVLASVLNEYIIEEEI